MNGVIDGGWDWVAAAWGISLTVFASYAISLHLRIKSARGKKEQR